VTNLLVVATSVDSQNGHLAGAAISSPGVLPSFITRHHPAREESFAHDAARLCFAANSTDLAAGDFELGDDGGPVGAAVDSRRAPAHELPGS